MPPNPEAKPTNPQERVIDPKTGVVMTPEELKEMRENTDKNNP